MLKGINSMKEQTYHSNERSTKISVSGAKEDTTVLLDKIFDRMKKRGFVIQTDKEIAEKFPTLSKSYWEGYKGDLFFKAHIYPAGFSLEFYQEINTENPYGGYYDSGKYEKMPYLIRCAFTLTRQSICEILEEHGFIQVSEPTFKNAMDEVIYKIKSCWHYKEGKELPEYDFADTTNARDQDGNLLRNGQVKYFYDRKRRLSRGTIYHNINNMWWVVLNKHDFTNMAADELFDIRPGELPERRIKRKEIPQRVRGEKLREKFNELGFCYEYINETHIAILRKHLIDELKNWEGLKMTISQPRKKDIKVLKRTGLKYAVIEVDANYFSRREAITFNENGFIGFAGWACDNSVTPFITAFEKWLNWMNDMKQKSIA